MAARYGFSYQRISQLVEKFKANLPGLSREQIGAALRLQAYGKGRRWVLEGHPPPPLGAALRPGCQVSGGLDGLRSLSSKKP